MTLSFIVYFLSFFSPPFPLSKYVPLWVSFHCQAVSDLWPVSSAPVPLSLSLSIPLSSPSISLAASSSVMQRVLFFSFLDSPFSTATPLVCLCDNKFGTSVGRALTFCGVVQRILPSRCPVYPSICSTLPALPIPHPSVCWGFVWHLTCVRETAPQIDLVENALPRPLVFACNRFKMQLNICCKKERNNREMIFSARSSQALL